MDEDKLLYNRLCDLARKRDDKNVPTFSKFLGIEEQVGLKFKNAVFWGGYEGAGRKILMFLPDWAQAEDFYDCITAVKITATDKKVYDHRDYLGSLMGLGLKREVIGDIAVTDGAAIMFCQSDIAPYIKENLTQVARSTVNCEILDELQEDIKQNYLEIKGTVASPRLDCVLSFIKNAGRSKAAEMIRAGLVKVNAKEVQDTSKMLKSGDVISIRGSGKFIFDGEDGISRKGRSIIKLRKLV